MSSFGPSEPELPLLLPDSTTPQQADPRKAGQLAALFGNDGAETDRHAEPRSGAAGRFMGRIAVFVVLTTIVVGGSWAAAKYSGLFDEKAAVKQMTHKVERADLVITVTQKGNVESAANIEIRCLVAGGGTITLSPGRQSAGHATPCLSAVCSASTTRTISSKFRPTLSG